METGIWRLGIVDDDALTLAALRSLIGTRLASYGVSVAWDVRSGNEAVDMCVARETRPDAVLVDMGMDDVDGAMTMRRIRRLSSEIILLAMTSHSLNRYRDAARFAGAQALLDKADFAGLAGCLRDCVLGKPYIQSGFPTPAQGVSSLIEQSDGSNGKRALSSREAEVMDWTIEGLTAKEVSARMAISETTVKTHIRHVIAKLQARNKLQAIRLWSEMRKHG